VHETDPPTRRSTVPAFPWIVGLRRARNCVRKASEYEKKDRIPA